MTGLDVLGPAFALTFALAFRAGKRFADLRRRGPVMRARMELRVNNETAWAQVVDLYGWPEVLTPVGAGYRIFNTLPAHDSRHVISVQTDFEGTSRW